uniref:Eukaryotic translation initiation factor 5 n=1 Tax=Panagrolaimus sp. JU765 TaxID=591449 RepID=A0AC34R287_9BILA
MANINVNRNVIDPFYRYKMPRLQAKVEGKGNGIKTVIANMVEIAKALERPPTYPTKYFGCELGAQTNFDLKNDRYIVNGEHDANKLQDLLDGFIRKFVLCPSCDNPETTLIVKRQTIHSKCKACGHAFIIDPKHKLSTFIMKNPPPTVENGNVEKKDSSSPVEELNNGFEFKENISNDDDEDDDWAEPTEDEKLSANIEKLVISKDLNKSVEDRLDMLHQFFIACKKDGTLLEGKKLVNEAERLELKTKAPILLAHVLFDSNVLTQLKTYQKLILQFVQNDAKAQRYFLGGIEQLIENHKKELLPKAAHILKALYDLDLVEEENIQAWGAKPSGKYVKKELSKQIIAKCEPVLKWLEEAEEDSEEEDDDEEQDDDDLEVAFDERGKVGEVIEHAKTNGVAKTQAAPEPIKVHDSDGEIDIDDI